MIDNDKEKTAESFGLKGENVTGRDKDNNIVGKGTTDNTGITHINNLPDEMEVTIISDKFTDITTKAIVKAHETVDALLKFNAHADIDVPFIALRKDRKTPLKNQKVGWRNGERQVPTKEAISGSDGRGVIKGCLKGDNTINDLYLVADKPYKFAVNIEKGMKEVECVTDVEVETGNIKIHCILEIPNHGVFELFDNSEQVQENIKDCVITYDTPHGRESKTTDENGVITGAALTGDNEFAFKIGEEEQKKDIAIAKGENNITVSFADTWAREQLPKKLDKPTENKGVSNEFVAVFDKTGKATCYKDYEFGAFYGEVRYIGGGKFNGDFMVYESGKLVMTISFFQGVIPDTAIDEGVYTAKIKPEGTEKIIDYGKDLVVKKNQKTHVEKTDIPDDLGILSCTVYEEDGKTLLKDGTLTLQGYDIPIAIKDGKAWKAGMPLDWYYFWHVDIKDRERYSFEGKIHFEPNKTLEMQIILKYPSSAFNSIARDLLGKNPCANEYKGIDLYLIAQHKTKAAIKYNIKYDGNGEIKTELRYGDYTYQIKTRDGRISNADEFTVKKDAACELKINDACSCLVSSQINVTKGLYDDHYLIVKMLGGSELYRVKYYRISMTNNFVINKKPCIAYATTLESLEVNAYATNTVTGAVVQTYEKRRIGIGDIYDFDK